MKLAQRVVRYAIFDLESWQQNSLRTHLGSNGFKPILGAPGDLRNLLETLPEHQAYFAIITCVNRRGLQGYNWMLEQVSRLRALCATLGILFVMDGSAVLRKGCLPPMVWVINTNDTFDVVPMQSEIDLQKTERCPAYRETGFLIQSAPLPRKQKKWCASATTPNYNIKHPSMLVPLAMASVRHRCEIYCEISPQEALTFYRVPYCSDTRKMVKHALESVRNSVSYVNQKMGSNLKLHLDHCDDLHLLECAADIGFDSIMADGSARGLAQNIAFTCKALALLDAYDVSVEGEVGNIDGAGARRWNRTRAADLECFLNETGVDYVGVHLGQFHGFSYDYQRSREKHALIVAQRENMGEDDWGAFLDGCKALDDECEALQMNRACDERRLLAECAVMALDGAQHGATSVYSLLRTLSSSAPLRCQHLLAQLEAGWLKRRLEKLQLRGALWADIAGASFHSTQHSLARLDIDLLEKLASLTQPTSASLVVHGGSSVPEDDLRLFPHYGVARVNFGTDVFRDYLTQLASCCSPQASAQLNSLQGRLAFLDEYASDWRGWLENPPKIASDFSDRLTALHLKRMTPSDSHPKLSLVE